jgi:hypothetical protein
MRLFNRSKSPNNSSSPTGLYQVRGSLGTHYFDANKGVAWVWVGSSGHTMQGHVTSGGSLVATAQTLSDLTRRLEDHFATPVSVSLTGEYQLVRLVESFVTKKTNPLFPNEQVEELKRLLAEQRVTVSLPLPEHRPLAKKVNELARWKAWSTMLTEKITSDSEQLTIVVDSYHGKDLGVWCWFVGQNEFNVGLYRGPSSVILRLLGLKSALEAAPLSSKITLVSHSGLLLDTLSPAREVPWFTDSVVLPSVEERELRQEVHAIIKSRNVTLCSTTNTDKASLYCAAQRRAKAAAKAYLDSQELSVKVHIPSA